MDYPIQSFSEIREHARAARQAGQKAESNPYAEGWIQHAVWQDAFEAAGADIGVEEAA